MVSLLILVCLILMGALVFVVYHALRWASVIFLLEDDLGEAIDIHERTIETLEGIQKTPMFFDSPELQIAVREALDNVKICQVATQKLINSFTQRSKQRYIRIIDKPQEEEAN
jgi:hypothetical protein